MRAAFPTANEIAGVFRRDIGYLSNGFRVPALLVAPEAPPGRSGPLPGLVVGQEAWGLTDHIVDVAANLAKEGYVCLVPDYYARTGGPARSAESARDVGDVMRCIDRIDNRPVLQ